MTVPFTLMPQISLKAQSFFERKFYMFLYIQISTDAFSLKLPTFWQTKTWKECSDINYHGGRAR